MNKSYFFWITGCQMNYADARQVSNELHKLGYQPTDQVEDADVVILQTCTVRQQAEDKAIGRLTSLRSMKEKNPEKTLAMMGCVVGVKGNNVLAERYPFVDVWMPPATDGTPLIVHLGQGEDLHIEKETTAQRFAIQDGEKAFPIEVENMPISAPVAVVYGCSHACTFCIIPQRRGVERTRPIGEIVSEIRNLVQHGVKEVVLLGQIVDRYGKDIPDGPDLADLLHSVHEVDELLRIRFLTSHPNYMSDRILKAVAQLPKVMPQIEVPIQAGDDRILAEMKRGYTADDYRKMIQRIREVVPGAAIHNDVIVGFPGESDEQFQRTLDIVSELKLDKVHIARYSPRPGTLSARRMEDDIPDEEKRRRFQLIEETQKQISQEKNSAFLNQVVEVLVEDKHKGRWRGRSPQGKLVFFDDSRELRGKRVEVQISYAGPWSMSGVAAVRVGPNQTGNSIKLPTI